MVVWYNSWMSKPYEKNDDRGDKHEGDENHDSERVIFVDRPNLNSDEFLKACQLHRWLEISKQFLRLCRVS